MIEKTVIKLNFRGWMRHGLTPTNPKEVATYNSMNNQYTRLKEIHWPGGYNNTPKDTPKCGFDNSGCPQGGSSY